MKSITGGIRKHPGIVGAMLVAAAIIAIASGGKNDKKMDGLEPGAEEATFEVRRGPMTISISEGGTIRSRDEVVVRSQLKRRATIISLVEEGVEAKKGDLLVEFDSAELIEDKYDQTLMVTKAEGGFTITKEKLEITRNQGRSDVEKAALEYEFSKQDVEQYFKGEHPKELKELNARIALAEVDLKRSIEKLKWSKVLFGQKFLSQTELQADELAQKKAELDLELAEGDLELLKSFTYKRRKAELESSVLQKEMALERTSRKARADLVQADAELAMKKSELARQRGKLEELEEQLINTKVYAPSAGMVVYASSASMSRWHSSEPLEEGSEVREREELISLPATDSVMANIKIHESHLDQVSVNMPVRVTFDAYPDKSFPGKIARVAPLPDATSRWVNPDLKLFATDVHFENEGLELRNGMSCKVEILVEQHKDALYVPLQCVIKIGPQPSVYVKTGNSYEARAVEIGMDNNRMIRIISGVEEGERVLMRPPLEDGTVGPDEVEPGEQAAGSSVFPGPLA